MTRRSKFQSQYSVGGAYAKAVSSGDWKTFSRKKIVPIEAVCTGYSHIYVIESFEFVSNLWTDSILKLLLSSRQLFWMIEWFIEQFSANSILVWTRRIKFNSNSAFLKYNFVSLLGRSHSIVERWFNLIKHPGIPDKKQKSKTNRIWQMMQGTRSKNRFNQVHYLAI